VAAPACSCLCRAEAFRIVNGYGLFRVMTKDRGEIVIEGSADGIDWLPYEFKWKPGDVKRAPRWCAPHQPRVDWQMWFAALGTPQQNPWFGGLIVRLLQGSRDVSRLLARNPFPDQRRATFGQVFIVTVSLLWRSIANLARGGNAKNSGIFADRFTGPATLRSRVLKLARSSRVVWHRRVRSRRSS